MFQLGFIGAGNMAQAILSGILSHHILRPDEIIAYDIDTLKTSSLSTQLGINIAGSNQEIVDRSKIILLAVKPQFLPDVISSVNVTEPRAFLSIMAGIDKQRLESGFGTNNRFLCIMPNLPLQAGEGMTCFSNDYTLTEEELCFTRNIFSSIGKVELLPASQIRIFGAIAGSSPAIVFMMIEAMADAACKAGMARAQAYEIASQAVLGSGKMARDSGIHVAALKDMVCSPAGTTIEGVLQLEKDGFRAAIQQSILSMIDRFDAMAEKSSGAGKKG